MARFLAPPGRVNRNAKPRSGRSAPNSGSLIAVCSTSQGDSGPRAAEAEAGVGAGNASTSADAEAIARFGAALAEAVRLALPDWVAQAVHYQCQQNNMVVADNGELVDRISEAGRHASEDIGSRLADLLQLDIDEQWTNPLSIIRSAVRYPSEILASLDCPPSSRDDYSIRANPHDVYDLTPASFADLGPEVKDLGIAWGAAKAHIHLQRRKREGQ